MGTAQVSRLLGPLIESLEDHAIITLDTAGFMTSWNAGAARLLGYRAEDAIGRSFACLYPPDDLSAERPRRELELARERGRLAHQGWRVRRDGERFWAAFVLTALHEGNGELSGFGLLIQDITPYRQLEERLREAQKLEAIGQLAGGVAHDFNNLITIIGGYSSMLLSTLDADDPSRTYVAEIKQAAERASALTRHLLAFRRKHVSAPKKLDLNALLREAERMLSRAIGEDITVLMNLAESVDPVKADPAQLEQVLINLALGAREAMPQGGTFVIETRNAAVCPGDVEDLLPGDYVMLAVRGSGAAARSASDLRVAMLQSFARHNQGHLQIESEPGSEYSVRIYLPAMQSGDDDEADASALRAHNRETVLLVDDEVGVRKVARLVLESQGYSVLEASNGLEAVEAAGRSKQPIHLVLTDVVMPEMSGAQLVQRLRLTHPEIKALFMSGYADEAVERHGLADTQLDFLQKPFTPYELARRTREMLDRKEGNRS